MADIFYTRDALNLLRGKKIYLIGDSNIRALYKDMVCLLVHNRLLTEKQLKEKAEKHFLGDDLLRGSPLTKGRAYREDRRFKSNGTHVEFHFITRCLNEDIKAMMHDFKNKRISAPDIIVMNSTLWDVNRWGWNGVEAFKDNMNELMRLFKTSLPPTTLVIWVTAPPLSVEIRGGFMIKQIEFAKFTMRFHVMEANMFAQQLLSQNGYNVLDFHFHLRWQVHWRNADGLHWTNRTMRHLCNLLLTHISLALRHPLPGNLHSVLLEKHKRMVRCAEFTADDAEDVESELQTTTTTASTSSAQGQDGDAVVFAHPRPPRPPPRRAVRRVTVPEARPDPDPAQGSIRNTEPLFSRRRQYEQQQQHQQYQQRRPPRQRSSGWNGVASYDAPSRPTSGYRGRHGGHAGPAYPSGYYDNRTQSSYGTNVHDGYGLIGYQNGYQNDDYTQDYGIDVHSGTYFDAPEAPPPQQIQSLWGPASRNSRHSSRHRPY